MRKVLQSVGLNRLNSFFCLQLDSGCLSKQVRTFGGMNLNSNTSSSNKSALNPAGPANGHTNNSFQRRISFPNANDFIMFLYVSENYIFWFMMIVRAEYCLLLLLLIPSMSVAGINGMPTTYKQPLSGNFEQPLSGFAWPTQQIPVVVEEHPEYVRNAVLDAMQIWNLAQTWFSNTYMVPSSPYKFVEVERLGQSYVKITFNQTQTRDDWGYTRYYYSYDSDGVFYKITVLISLDLTLRDGRSLSPTELQALATHELGHALGLNQTVFSEMDLMNHFSLGHRIATPSTLNLFAVALLSGATSRNDMPQNPVTLPQDISYWTPSESVIPEIPYPLITFTLGLGIAMTLIRVSKCRRAE
jgi:hypothetical protein